MTEITDREGAGVDRAEEEVELEPELVLETGVGPAENKSPKSH